jgi:hypothetical protein
LRAGVVVFAAEVAQAGLRCRGSRAKDGDQRQDCDLQRFTYGDQER